MLESVVQIELLAALVALVSRYVPTNLCQLVKLALGQQGGGLSPEYNIIYQMWLSVCVRVLPVHLLRLERESEQKRTRRNGYRMAR